MRKFTFLKAAFLGAFLAGGNANAQMVSGDVFLKGKYVEVGIGHLGYYGSDNSAPSGYHPHPGSGSKLGFVADPDMDGWATGTPAYMGDYFLPGSPFEGWMLQVDSARCQGYNTGISTSLMACSSGGSGTGANLSYTTSGSKVIGTWQGVIDSVQLTQITTLDTNNLYFTVKIVLTNLGILPKDDLYYIRSTDADNDQTWPGGAFTTDNRIEAQMPDSAASIVTATGRSTTLPTLSLGSSDTNSRAIIYNSWPLTRAQDLAAVYNQTYSAFYDVGVNHPGDIAVGLVFHVAHLSSIDSAGDSTYRTTAEYALHPKNTASFTYFIAFGRRGLDSALKATAYTPTLPLAVNNVNAQTINVFPNPAQNIINIDGLNADDHLVLYDMMGHQVNVSWSVNHSGLNAFPMNAVSAGNYILLVTDAQGKARLRTPVRKL
jgi:hypothetical protein